MQTIGLTGGMGMGKSAAAELLRQRGVPVIDTDVVARQVVEPGQSALAQVAAAFGADLLGADGRLRREELARRVFGGAAARQQLEEILHPAIHAVWQEQVGIWRAEGRKLAVVVIPLLFETRTAAWFDLTVCVACTASTQHERLRGRGWSSLQIQQRLAAQLPIEQKMALAHRVLWSEGELDVLAKQLDRILPPA
jgi:dephospho-CoA kinase